MKLFGTDGIRGLINEENMDPEFAVKVGRALVAFCLKRNDPLKIVIGRDTRESGPMLEDAIAAGIISMGGEVMLAGVIPTPGLAYLVKEQKAGGGIIISASHNHFSYNGLKLFSSTGEKLDTDEEQEINAYIMDPPQGKIGKDFYAGKKNILADAGKKYVDFLLEKKASIPNTRDIKLVLDCANGATFEVAPAVFSKVAKDIESLFANPDGRNINESCGSQNIENLQKEVLNQKADLGLAFDGDGDRLIAVDELGNALNGDYIVYIIAKMLKEKSMLKNNLAVTTVMSNLGFVSKLKSLGIKHIASAVGDHNVFMDMKKNDAILGGEESGHIICSEIQSAGDGIAGGLLLFEAVQHFNKPLSELASELVMFPKLLINIEVKSKPAIETLPEVTNAIKEAERKLGEEGRVLVRYSGTENLCRVMVEGRNEGEIRDYAEKIAEAIRKRLS